MNIPEFADYRVTNDGVMVADIGFKKQLWALDPELDVVWDWASQKWEIWRFPGQKNVKKKKVINESAHYVLRIETKGKTFRELGADILIKLQQGDTHKYSLKQLVGYFNNLDDNLNRAKQRNLETKMGAIKSEVDWFFRGVRSQVPKVYEKMALKIEGPSNLTRLAGVLNG